MSLKTFHIVFIAVSATLSLLMLIWGIQGYRASGDGTSLGVGIAGLVGLSALLPYGRWFRNKYRKIAGAIAAVFAGQAAVLPSAWACSVCFGDPNSEMTKGLKAGIILLVFIIAGVLAGIASIGIAWARRAKALGPHP